MQRVVTECGLSQEEAMQRLVALNWNDAAVIKQWTKENKKDSSMMAKITKKLARNSKNKGDVDTKGAIEMKEVQEQEEMKGDGDEMNEGQSAVTSTGDMSTDDGTAHVTASTVEKSADTVSADQINIATKA